MKLAVYVTDMREMRNAHKILITPHNGPNILDPSSPFLAQEANRPNFLNDPKMIGTARNISQTSEESDMWKNGRRSENAIKMN